MFKGLNKAQKTALLKVLMCRDYVLIKGYPGTGECDVTAEGAHVPGLRAHQGLPRHR